LANEFTRVSEAIMNSEFLNKGLRYVFALLSKHCLELYSDMHMSERLAMFNRAQLTFVELGIWIENEELGCKFHYFKCVVDQQQSHKREVYLLSIADDNLEKWESCLGIQKEFDTLDPCYETIKKALLKKTQK
jgi:hypothetical protein